MIHSLGSLNWLVEIMEDISREGQAEIIAHAMKVREREKLEKETLLKGKTIFDTEIDRTVKQNMERMVDMANRFESDLTPEAMFVVYLKARELTEQSTTHETITEYELVRKQREVPIRKMYEEQFPDFNYEKAIELKKKTEITGQLN